MNEPDVPQSIEHDNGALEKMKETHDMLNQAKNGNQGNSRPRPRHSERFGAGPSRDPRKGGSTRNQKERLDLPSDDQQKSPAEFRAEILDAMKGRYPKKYERFISEYYQELVK